MINSEFDRNLQLVALKGSRMLFEDYQNAWENDLDKIERFSTMELIHQRSLRDHAHMVRNLSSLLTDHLTYALDYDIDYLRVDHLASHHDDPEVLTSDIPSHVKRAMSPDELEQLKREEVTAAAQLTQHYFPQEFSSDYILLYEEVSEKKTLEAQVVDIADKWVGVGETLNEIRCGNSAFYAVLERYHTIVGELQKHTLWEDVADFSGLRPLPSIGEAAAMQPISMNVLNQDEGLFWRQVLDPHLPRCLRTWMEACLRISTPEHNGLFTGWQDQIDESTNMWVLHDPLITQLRK